MLCELKNANQFQESTYVHVRTCKLCPDLKQKDISIKEVELAPGKLERLGDYPVLWVERVELNDGRHEHLVPVLAEHGGELDGGREHRGQARPEDGVVPAVQQQGSVYDVEEQDHAV